MSKHRRRAVHALTSEDRFDLWFLALLIVPMWVVIALGVVFG